MNNYFREQYFYEWDIGKIYNKNNRPLFILSSPTSLLKL